MEASDQSELMADLNIPVVGLAVLLLPQVVE
jgi:hypothetical protein